MSQTSSCRATGVEMTRCARQVRTVKSRVLHLLQCFPAPPVSTPTVSLNTLKPVGDNVDHRFGVTLPAAKPLTYWSPEPEPPAFANAAEEALWYFPLDDDVPLVVQSRRDDQKSTNIHHANCSCENKLAMSCTRSTVNDAAKIAFDALHAHLFDLVGNNYQIGDFDGSPQQHALFNRHLLDYFKGVQRSRETTPYAIDPSQMYLLPGLGMEPPLADAPTRPHGLHKAIEEGQLRRMAQWLPKDEYGLLSVKSSKLHLLPTPASVQNPVYQAKDVSRYPGSGVSTATLANHALHFLHDVSSEVGPHELVERLVADRPEGQLFVTGMNPIEVVDRVRSFEPASHIIDYDLDGFNYIFTGSESESYYTPIGVTVSWLRTNVVVGSNGVKYQVVLLDYKLGHCVWHIFPSDTEPQGCRTFSTGSYVQLPAVLTGTWQDEWVPAKMITAILSFAPRTPDQSARNFAAKVSQLMTGVLPRMTAREHWIATHLVSQMPGNSSFWTVAKLWFWRALSVVTLQWHLLKEAPPVYDFVDERKRYRVLHPTAGGGWSPRNNSCWKPSSIPNNPTGLHRLSAFTSAVFTFVLPKIIIGELVSAVVFHVPLWKALTTLVRWADVSLGRMLLTAAIVAITAVLPGHVVKVFKRLAGHFWRQLWLPGWVRSSVPRAITEICGGPGASIAMYLPGRGWFFQSYLWAVGLKSLLPVLMPGFILPWVAVTTVGGACALTLWIGLIAFENYLAYQSGMDRPISPAIRQWSYGLADWASDFWKSDFHESDPSLARLVGRFALSQARVVAHGFRLTVYHCARWCRYEHVRPGDSVVESYLGSVATSIVTVPTTRRVDTPLPAVMVQQRVAIAPGAGMVAVEPSGLTFLQWSKEVLTAYNADPVRYPALTPNQACFWDCVAGYGGTAHMWYSWFMAYTGEVPDRNDPVVGNVTQKDMVTFSAASQFGLRLRGLTDINHDSVGGWPVLDLVLSRSPIAGLLHVEPARALVSNEPIANLARLLRTVRSVAPQWHDAFVREINAANVDSVPHYTAFSIAASNGKVLPDTRNGVVDALAASYSIQALTAVRQDGFAFDFGARYFAPYPRLVDYGAPVRGQRIASTSSASRWSTLNGVARRLRVLVPDAYVDPPNVKVGASATATGQNASRGNVAPTPATWTVHRNRLAKDLSEYKAQALPILSLSEEVIQYTPDVQRAARLVSDLKAHPAVLGSRGDPRTLQALDSILDLCKVEGVRKPTTVRMYMGVAGSGKTTATIAYLKTLTPDVRGTVRIASHTESLRAQAKYKLDFPEFRGVNFPTIPSLLTEPCVGPVVLDEAGKYWGGVLDLIILANPLLTEVVVNGDPAQTMGRFPVSNTQSEYDLSPLAAIACQVTKYATVTHRLPRAIADVLGVHTTNPTVGHLTHTVTSKLNIPVCTASPRYAGVLAGAGRQAYTYEGVQGEDFRTDVEVDASGLESALLDRSAYVAITRSSSGVYLHMDALDDRRPSPAPATNSDLINSILYGMRGKASASADHTSWMSRAAFMKHLHHSMPGLAWFARVGASVPSDVFQSVAMPATCTFPNDGGVADFITADGPVHEGAPVEEYVRETHWDAKEHRELPGRGGATDQFKETAFVNPHVHKRQDGATYFMSVQKRLTSSSAASNVARKINCPRRDMCDEFDRLVPHCPQWSPGKHAEYVDRSIVEYTSTRTSEAVLAKVRSHDPDRTGADIKISLKNQVIKKDEKRKKKEAIPGQLVHEYDIAQTLEDAPYSLFLEDELFDAFPDCFLFYRRMNPQKFIDMYQARWRVNNGVSSSDVTRWDVGCDAGVLNFDEHVMRRCGFPSDYVDAYVARRLNSRSQHGVMSTMQNSGDRYTWTLNSLRRAVVTSLVNSITDADTVAINGDDAAVDRFALSHDFPDSPWEFKNLNGMREEFSGFTLGGIKPEYSADGILYRTMILESRDPSALDKWVNYLDLLAYADLATPEALAVAISARRHMPAELFAKCVPSELLPILAVV